MSRQAIKEYFVTLYERYHRASVALKSRILDELCATIKYNRKYAIRKLNGPPPDTTPRAHPRRRGYTYSAKILDVLAQVWAVAGYPCGVRLHALVPCWLPWIQKRWPLKPAEVQQLRTISPSQLDRRLVGKKRQLKKRRYGRTKPGTLLKHHIPIKTDHWDVHEPGFVEMDTVAHCGNSAEGEFAHTVNQTDIVTTWVESRAILGKGEAAVVAALDEMRAACPFTLRGYDSDNGSEFLNWHLLRYCAHQQIQPTRSRPYKKDDNAHIEQKNWTHVRKLVGYARYESPAAVAALNDLYRNELPQFMNLFLPSMKLVKKVRVGSRRTRQYDIPQTPLDRVIASKHGDPRKVAALLHLRATLNPFTLAATIDRKLQRLGKLASAAVRPAPATPSAPLRAGKSSLTKTEEATLQEVARLFGGTAFVRAANGKLRGLTPARETAA